VIELLQEKRPKRADAAWGSAMSTTYIPTAIQTEVGRWYFGSICPNTGEVLAIEEDDSGGQERFPSGKHPAACHHCRTVHRFAGSEIFSFRADESMRG